MTINSPPVIEVLEVRLESGRVHGHEHAGLVAGRQDVVICEVDLEGGDARDRPGGGPDLGGEIGAVAEVVPEERRGAGESVAGQLHPVARVAGETDDDSI